ncbi:Septal ring factor EnvC [Parelusimicrobium proximum]|uniref:murein hydrolase activator EnvC family protein n=1 Tax=Parelusimicrobium proximum TaxID=3228953 RepID=UPI003D1869E2
MAKVLAAFITFIFLALAQTYAQEGQTLEDLRERAKQKEEELKKYKEQERKLSLELSRLEKKSSETNARKSKIDYDIAKIEQSLMSTESKKEALEKSLPVWQYNTEYEIKEYYLRQALNSKYIAGNELEEDIALDYMIPAKADFVARIKKENNLTKEQIINYEKRNRELLNQSSKIAEESSLLTKNFVSKKTDLEGAQKMYEEAKRELDELNASAEQMKKLLEEAEARRKKEEEKEAKKQGSPRQGEAVKQAVIDEKKNSLPWPVDGKVISAFGKEYRQDLKTYIFRDGVKISAKKGETVFSVAEGTVIYAGSFRSYGNVVILDHGKGFFTIYGFLSDITVERGDNVGQRTPIGIVGMDTQQGSMGTGRIALYFEVRRGTHTEDPVQWLK